MVNKKLLQNADIPMVCHALKHFRHIQGVPANSVASALSTSTENIKNVEQGNITNLHLLLREVKMLGLGDTHFNEILQNNQKVSMPNLTLSQYLLRKGILQSMTPIELAKKVGYKKSIPTSKYLKQHVNVFCHIAHILGDSNKQILNILKQHGINLYGSDFHSYVKRNCVLHNLSLFQLAKYSGTAYPSLYYHYKNGYKKPSNVQLKKIKNVFNENISVKYAHQQHNYKDFIALLNKNHYKSISDFAKHMHVNYAQIKQLALGESQISFKLLYRVSTTLNIAPTDLIAMLHLLNSKPSPFLLLLGKKGIFTQSALAKRSHISSASISGILKGYKKVNNKMALKLAKALNISINKLAELIPSNHLSSDVTIVPNQHNTKQDTKESYKDNSQQLKRIFSKLQSLNQKINDDYRNEMQKVSTASNQPIKANPKEYSAQINKMIIHAINNYENHHNAQILSNQDIIFQRLYNACKNNTIMKHLVLNVTKLNTPNAQLILNLVNGLLSKTKGE